MENDILSLLRSETATYHKEIEQNPYAIAINEKTLTWDQYTSYR